MPLALTNACFEGKNGHDAGVTPYPELFSGHQRYAGRRMTHIGGSGSIFSAGQIFERTPHRSRPGLERLLAPYRYLSPQKAEFRPVSFVSDAGAYAVFSPRIDPSSLGHPAWKRR